MEHNKSYLKHFTACENLNSRTVQKAWRLWAWDAVYLCSALVTALIVTMQLFVQPDEIQIHQTAEGARMRRELAVQCRTR